MEMEITHPFSFIHFHIIYKIYKYERRKILMKIIRYTYNIVHTAEKYIGKRKKKRIGNNNNVIEL